MRTTTLLTTAATLGLATITNAATTTTINLFQPGEETIPYDDVEASVIAVNGDTTTLAIVCGPSAAASTCALHSPVTITEGPSTFTVSAVITSTTDDAAYTVTLIEDCDITSVTQGASCSISMDYTVAYSGITTSYATSAEASLEASLMKYSPVTVTAGADKLSASAKATGTSSGSSSSDNKSGSTTSATGSAATHAASSSKTSSGSSASSTPNGAAGQSTMTLGGAFAAAFIGVIGLL
ncbi:putative GPI anchored cell wall protein [Aspergillus saccharolyticus JOP 1030-1]|uniref:GPI anchored protein n=1 Tax=Aspergillus saccharolyticus JOP 1030-1 TaxID=1450539 RepID=A0A318ZJI7_9EURO|nr:hypothetical protein BP01DRAFT_354260 [Aspergillus saccharolyticus JOP 1030-1]PYH47741.1 hypothetical protein BP01DRAFT_354260 [Aspergillus saccharolyticus JOP 1030-1]